MATLSENLRVNFTADERRRIEQAAQAEDRSVAYIIRRATLAHLAALEAADEVLREGTR